jgi:hypothetical protein
MSGKRVALWLTTSEAKAADLRGAIEEIGGSETALVQLASEGEGFDELADAMMPNAVPSAALVEQVRRNVSERVQFLETYGALTAEELADAVGSDATNRRSLAARWRAEQKVFAVRGPSSRVVYPAFQFDFDRGAPRPVIADVLAALPVRLREGGWQLALWWDTPMDVLGWLRPVDVLDKDPATVVAAAEDEAREWAEANPSQQQ